MTARKKGVQEKPQRELRLREFSYEERDRLAAKIDDQMRSKWMQEHLAAALKRILRPDGDSEEGAADSLADYAAAVEQDFETRFIRTLLKRARMTPIDMFWFRSIVVSTYAEVEEVSEETALGALKEWLAPDWEK